MTVAAFFDMDKTLLSVDTAMSWTKFLYRRGELPASMLAKAVYWSTLYKLAVLDMESVFAKLALDLRGDLESDMIAKCAIWYRDDVAPHVAPAGRVMIEHHRQRGHTIVLATGSTIYAATPVAANVGIEHVLSSRLEVAADGVFTGKASVYCFGHHKVTLAERWAEEHGIDLARSYFYSDSYNDLPMLARVGTPIAVNPDARLRRHARQRGWAIQAW
jgi:HAD superfamily hydrolase (TIGR01490 family)